VVGLARRAVDLVTLIPNPMGAIAGTTALMTCASHVATMVRSAAPTRVLTESAPTVVLRACSAATTSASETNVVGPTRRAVDLVTLIPNPMVAIADTIALVTYASHVATMVRSVVPTRVPTESAPTVVLRTFSATTTSARFDLGVFLSECCLQTVFTVVRKIKPWDLSF